MHGSDAATQKEFDTVLQMTLEHVLTQGSLEKTGHPNGVLN